MAPQPVFNDKCEIKVSASVGQVWEKFTNIDGWPSWHSAVSEAKMNGSLEPGTTFDWKSGGMGIHSTITEVVPQKTIVWTCTALGTKVTHRWDFLPEGTSTRVITEEQMSGWLPAILRPFNKQFVAKTLETALSDLKHEVDNQP